MTTDTTTYTPATVPNPYFHAWTMAGKGRGRGFERRYDLAKQFAWAIPNANAITALVRHSPVVEVGAGLGYWAALAQLCGADVLPFDKGDDPGHAPLFAASLDEAEAQPQIDELPFIPTTRRTVHGCPAFARLTTHTTVYKADHLIARHFPDRTLFLCWPTYSVSWAHEATLAYFKAGGRTVIYVGEGEGGCTADDRFHKLLHKTCSQVAQIDIPQWDGMHDDMTIWTRR